MCKQCAVRAKNTLKQTTDGRVAKPFKVYSTKAIKHDKSKTVEELAKKHELNYFFDQQANQVPERCENCNRLLMAYSTWAKRGVTAHILPKSLFLEVATNPNNIMFLGTGLFSDCNCHTNYDNNDAAYRKKMPCYKLALKRYEAFVNELSEPQQIKAEKYLGL